MCKGNIMTTAHHFIIVSSVFAFGQLASPVIAAPTEQPVTVGAFNALSTTSVDVAVKVGPAQSVVLIGEPAELAKLEVVVEKQQLKIRPKKTGLGWRTYDVKNVKARVTVPTLVEAGVAGSGGIFATGINAKEFEVNIGGSGSFSSYDAKVGKIDLAIGGSGNIEIAGSCMSADISVGGSGSVQAQKLLCQAAEVSIGGSGDVKVFASKSVETSVAGSGDVVVYGNPAQRKKSIAGSGSVTYK